MPRNISNHFPATRWRRPVKRDPAAPSEASEGPSDQISAISLAGAFSFSFRAAVPNVFPEDEQRFRFFPALDVLMARDKGPHSLSLPIFVQSDLLLLLLLGKKRQNGRRLDGALEQRSIEDGKERGNAMPDKKTSWTKQGRTGSKETCEDTTIFLNK